MMLPSRYADFIDHLNLTWEHIRRVRCRFNHRFHYEYPGPIHNLKQRLVVTPPDQYGTQHLRHHHLNVDPNPLNVRQVNDRFGNRIFEVDIPTVEHSVTFDIVLELENHRTLHPHLLPTVIGEHYLQLTTLTAPNRTMSTMARELGQKAFSPEDLAERIHVLVHERMQYEGGLTNINTTAAEAFELEHGLCQDYAHIMIGLCRSAGLPARYVSGHLLGEGGSHAWVEVLIPYQNGLKAVSFDPTNNRRPHLGYVTVAVGRDYRDVSPTSGSFSAPYGGQLTCSKQAVLTMVEYDHGEIVQVAGDEPIP